LEIVDDFLIKKNEMEWIGVFVKMPRKKKWLVILNKNVHEWLVPFYDVFIGFR